MHYNDIAQEIIEQGLRTKLGATPAATVNALMAKSIKDEGERSPYRRVARGVFMMAGPDTAGKAAGDGSPPPSPPVHREKLTPTVERSDEDEEQYDIVTSFGMFWRRENVIFANTMKLLGKQKTVSEPVDFYGQLGVYLLYDGREVIYVGRSTDRPLGRRLFEHTQDRLASRWDRFSWFGLMPVTDDGKLHPLPEAFESSKLIPALEAILVEALEPRQNRKRGDDLASVEYIQEKDPEMTRQEEKDLLNRLSQRE